MSDCEFDDTCINTRPPPLKRLKRVGSTEPRTQPSLLRSQTPSSLSSSNSSDSSFLSSDDESSDDEPLIPSLRFHSGQDILDHYTKQHPIADRVLENKRSVIRERLLNRLGSADWSGIDKFDLEYLFQQYDTEFFGGFLQKAAASKSGRRNRKTEIHFRTTHNHKITERAGQFDPQQMAITMSVHLFLALPRRKENKGVLVNGVLCLDRTKAFMIVFEHELLHYLIHLFGPRHEQGHGPLFTALRKGVFQHPQNKHSMSYTGGDGAQFALTREKVLNRQEQGKDVKFYIDRKCYVGKVIEVGRVWVKVKARKDKAIYCARVEHLYPA
eukprot:TRINITY_DN103806_c0_g1_i1.p1 TRINITY_DN103806_c0_g1~~TRINITY_DN103806_c0_g1_i1.p1  ORF type:complete len:327 (+),score=32.77 TRINITY_DN103806_c0_g1_i1:58-1038(+)